MINHKWRVLFYSVVAVMVEWRHTQASHDNFSNFTLHFHFQPFSLTLFLNRQTLLTHHPSEYERERERKQIELSFLNMFFFHSLSLLLSFSSLCPFYSERIVSAMIDYMTASIHTTNISKQYSSSLCEGHNNGKFFILHLTFYFLINFFIMAHSSSWDRAQTICQNGPHLFSFFKNSTKFSNIHTHIWIDGL